jgi:hypothetical protein
MGEPSGSRNRGKMRHIRNSLAIYSPVARKFLFSIMTVSIGACGDHRLSHKYKESQ